MKLKLINLTPHDIVFTDGTVIPTSGMVARVSVSQIDDGDINGIPVKKQVFGDIVDLPDSRDNTIYIVSAIVLNAAKAIGRTDVVAPDTNNAIRNDKGHIVAVPALVR